MAEEYVKLNMTFEKATAEEGMFEKLNERQELWKPLNKKLKNYPRIYKKKY